jgi:hypothetical protein
MLVAYCLCYPTSLGIRYAEDEMNLAVFAQDFATAMGGVDARACAWRIADQAAIGVWKSP